MTKFKALMCALLMSARLAGCNRQMIDTVWRYDYAIIELPTGEIVEGEVSSWRDYEDSDSVQIVFSDGAVYYTHINRVVLISNPTVIEE